MPILRQRLVELGQGRRLGNGQVSHVELVPTATRMVKKGDCCKPGLCSKTMFCKCHAITCSLKQHTVLQLKQHTVLQLKQHTVLPFKKAFHSNSTQCFIAISPEAFLLNSNQCFQSNRLHCLICSTTPCLVPHYSFFPGTLTTDTLN